MTVVDDVCRKFDVALDVGCGRGHIARHILEDTVGVLYQCDMAEQVLVCTIDLQHKQSSMHYYLFL